MADIGTKLSQESLSSNDDFVNVENPVSEHSSPEIVEEEEEAGEEEEGIADKQVDVENDKQGWLKQPVIEQPPPPQQTAGVDELMKRKPPPLPSAGMEVPPATGYLSFLNVLHPLVLYIIYWHDLKLSVVALLTSLVVLATLCMNTMLHTIVLLLLSANVVSLLYIVIKIAIDSFYNRDIRNPFQAYLDRNEGIPEEDVIKFVRYAVRKVNCYFKGLVKLVFFDNTFSSLKFMMSLFFLSYLTNCVDFITAVTITIIFLFSAPPLYSRYQSQVDSVIDKLVTTLTTVYSTIYSKVPFLPKAKED